MKHFLFTEKYRPHTVQDTILPKDLKLTFQSFVDQKNIPNLLLCGKSGIGKTSIAKAMLDELGCDYIIINGSMHGNIDTLRTTIMNFASTVSFAGGRKYVILDEADNLNANSTQLALRNFMETFSDNCGFILTCNFKNKIIDALHSRCIVVDFKISKEESSVLAREFLGRLKNILDAEHIEYDKNVLVDFIQKHYPDWRRILNEVQRYSSISGNLGKIDAGILSNHTELTIKNLIDCMKNKDFTGVRTWIAENSDMDSTVFYRLLYDNASKIFTPAGVAQLILIISKYQYQEAFVADKEINTAAMCVEIMIDCDFK